MYWWGVEGMKVNIRINTDVDEQEEIIGLVKYLFTLKGSVGKTRLVTNNNICNGRIVSIFGVGVSNGVAGTVLHLRGCGD